MTNLSDFVAMGGYGFYVWGAYLVTALVIVIEVVGVRARFKASRKATADAGPPSMRPRTRRLAWIGAGLAALAVAAALVLNAFQSNLVFFFTPSQVAAKEAPQGRAFRVGGMVESGSLAREPNSLTVHFLVTDTAMTIPVTYTGLLPDLFKEGKGVVAQGTLGPDGVFHATEVLAKHDENYMPPEAKAAVDAAQKGMTMKSLREPNRSMR